MPLCHFPHWWLDGLLLPDGYSQIFGMFAFGSSRLKDYASAILPCKIWSLPFLGLRQVGVWWAQILPPGNTDSQALSQAKFQALSQVNGLNRHPRFGTVRIRSRFNSSSEGEGKGEGGACFEVENSVCWITELIGLLCRYRRCHTESKENMIVRSESNITFCEESKESLIMTIYAISKWQFHSTQ